jgi:hypothetical protein
MFICFYILSEQIVLLFNLTYKVMQNKPFIMSIQCNMQFHKQQGQLHNVVTTHVCP